jgi:protein prenyltransferase alpha subunit repeat containing protein 1
MEAIITTLSEYFPSLSSSFFDPACKPIDEIGIIPVSQENREDTPPIVYIDRQLGISSTVLKPLFKYAIEKLFLVLQKENRLLKFDTDLHEAETINNLTRVILIIKGDMPLAYNSRKRLIDSGFIRIHHELQLSSLLLGRQPKSPSNWHHRRYCLRTHLFSMGRTRLSLGEIETEREICKNMSEKYPKNYYAWMHRLWLTTHMTTIQVRDTHTQNKINK